MAIKCPLLRLMQRTVAAHWLRDVRRTDSPPRSLVLKKWGLRTSLPRQRLRQFAQLALPPVLAHPACSPRECLDSVEKSLVGLEGFADAKVPP
jgi:hypothetical protein